jgi:transglycosylase-like protein
VVSLAAAGAALALWTAAQTGGVRAELRAHVAEALGARVPGARLLGEARLSPGFELVFGPVVVPARAPGAHPVLTIDRVAVKPRLAALLGARLEAGSVRLDGVVVDAGVRGQALGELADVAATARGPAAQVQRGAPPQVTLRDLHVRVALARGPRAVALEVGPLSGEVAVSREEGRNRARVVLSLPGGGDCGLDLGWGEGPPSLAARVRGAGPEALPAPLRARLPFELRRGTVDLTIDAPRLMRDTPLTAAIGGRAREVEIRSSRLAPQPIGPLAGSFAGTLRWDPAHRRLALERGRVELGAGGGASIEVEGSLALRPEPNFAISACTDALDWASTLAALPPALEPPPEAPRLEGTLAAHLALAGPLRRPAAWRLDGDVELHRLRQAAAQQLALDRPFAFRAPLPEGRDREVVIGPSNPAFVSLATLPAYVWRAVVLSEDAGFFAHHGFDVREVQDALARTGGRRLRGASTLTQQLAKNLFLSPDRTLARKLREALATLAIESSLPKRRILEIYLNAVEWGPAGVRGLGEAAVHWFGKDARDLSPKEAAFLATVLPNPVRYDLYRRRGALTERWEERVRSLLVKMREADVLDEAQFEEAWYAPLAFAGR